MSTSRGVRMEQVRRAMLAALLAGSLLLPPTATAADQDAKKPAQQTAGAVKASGSGAQHKISPYVKAMRDRAANTAHRPKLWLSARGAQKAKSR